MVPLGNFLFQTRPEVFVYAGFKKGDNAVIYLFHPVFIATKNCGKCINLFSPGLGIA